jgi:hypothetical protein
MTSILHLSDPHFQSETMARLLSLANGHPNWDIIALTGCAGVLPEHWNDWPQSLKLSVPGNHDSPETFVHLTSWIHETWWFRRRDDLAFLGINTSSLSSPFGTLDEQLDAFWDEDITGVLGFVVLTHQWPLENEVDGAGELLAKFIDKRQLLVLDGHNHPRGTNWEMNAKLGSNSCFRSTVISCNAPKGTGHLITWSSKAFDCETVRGEYEKPKRVVIPASRITFGIQPRRPKENQLSTEAMTSSDAWIECKCGLSQKRSGRICRFCGKALRNQS